MMLFGLIVKIDQYNKRRVAACSRNASTLTLTFFSMANILEGTSSQTTANNITKEAAT